MARKKTPIVTDNKNAEDLSERSARRRKTLGMIAAGGGVLASQAHLPQTWSRPVVESVVLPAHAAGSPTGTQTSAPPTQIVCSTFTCTVTGWAEGQTGRTQGENYSVAADSGNTAPLTTYFDTLTAIPYTESFNRDGSFYGMLCSGTQTFTFIQSAASGDTGKEQQWISRATNISVRGTAARIQYTDTSIFVFTADCAGTQTQTFNIGP